MASSEPTESDTHPTKLDTSDLQSGFTFLGGASDDVPGQGVAGEVKITRSDGSVEVKEAYTGEELLTILDKAAEKKGRRKKPKKAS